jgi:hypothetical protein
MKWTALDSDKALTVLVYIATALPEKRNVYKVLKAIYRANKAHLAQYGRQIFNEEYQALEFGTVPALAYDMVTHVRDGKPQPRMPSNIKESIRVATDDTITALTNPNMRGLSETEIECINEAIEFYRHKDFGEVKTNAHEDAAYNAAPLNSFIPLEQIVLTLPNGEIVLKHLKAA